MKFLSNLSKTKKILLGLAVLAGISYLFYYLGKSSIEARLKADLAAIEKTMSSGRATATELVELNMKRKAILQQYLKSI